ncbi:UPF0175 family protein [Priestia megaterium]|uniref:UPF0175 family protein n=1 Tax=Priestia megaterium TaxID=1404 RepID=UPI002E1F6F1D|nr:UPF0175 family protein [Priestia megaterium]
MSLDKEMVNVPISKELEPLLKNLFKEDDLAQNVQITSSVMLFIAKKVTFKRAAELSGYSLNAFIDMLHKLGINWMEYGEEEYLDDMEALRKLQDD